MAKLTVLAVALAALVAFATAHTTIVTTTTVNDDNPFTEQTQCSQRLQGQHFNSCRHLFFKLAEIPFEEDNQRIPLPQDGRQCCKELKNVGEQCACEAMKQVFREVHQQLQHRQEPQFEPGSQEVQKLKQKAQMFPNVCNLQSKQCEFGTIETYGM